MDFSERKGNFTSSQIHRLCVSLKSGKPSSAFYMYIDDVKCEIILNRSSNVEVNTKPLKYGSLMEIVLFQKEEIGLEYSMVNKATIKHSKIKHFAGTPDLIQKGVKVGEIKCFYPKNFAKLSLCLLSKDIVKIKKEFPSVYWQVVSNAILCNVKKAEIIVYMPYKKEIEQILKDIEDTNLLEGNNLNPSDYYFMTYDSIETLPYLPENSSLKNINRFEFEVPNEDIILLKERLKEANEILDSELSIIKNE